MLETSEAIVETMDEGHTEVEFTLRCESGTYVKETVHGDGGRTQPRWLRSSAHAATCCGLMWRTSTPIEVFRSSVALK